MPKGTNLIRLRSEQERVARALRKWQCIIDQDILPYQATQQDLEIWLRILEATPKESRLYDISTPKEKYTYVTNWGSHPNAKTERSHDNLSS